ncbi:MAG TPA: ABC transporter permease, partial [Ideonella sp.]|nr:ABC transporter permease [Ideonella sp.]
MSQTSGLSARSSSGRPRPGSARATPGTAAAVAGGWWPAAQAARLSPALALKGLGQLQHRAPPWIPGAALLAAAGGLALLPPVGELPLAAYASVAALLVGGIALVPYAVFALLGRRRVVPAHRPLALLALQRARFFRSTATAAVAGVVASLALSVALTVMVASFRDSVTHWLDVVLPADLYVRTANNTAA